MRTRIVKSERESERERERKREREIEPASEREGETLLGDPSL
jgi:hypothetical protein